MNWKPTWVLLVAAAIMLAFIVLIEHPLRRQRESQASRIILPGFDPSLVTNIEIHPWGQGIVQAVRPSGTNHAWRLLQPVAYPAENDLFAALLDALKKLEWGERITEKELNDRPNAQEEFGFTKPLFTLLLQGSGPDRRLEIGQLGAFNDEVYLQVVGNTSIYQTPAAAILRWLPRDKRLWRDQALLSLTNVSFQTLRVRSAGQEFDLERDATNHLWYMSKPLPPARADTPKINELLSRLQTVLVADFVTDDPQADLESYGIQSAETTPELELSFLDGTNTVAGVQMGHSYSNFPAYAYARREGPGNIVVLAKESLKAWQAPYTNFLDQHFISMSPGLITSIAVRGEDDFEVQRQTNGQWLVAAGKNFPADSILMEYWLAQFTNMTTEIAKRVVTDFSDYGLSHPSLQYTLFFSPKTGAKTEARIDFGANQAGKVFERRLDEDFVNSINTSDFDLLPRASWELRDRDVWHFASSNVVSVTIHQRGGVLKLLRDPDGNWTYAPGFSSQVPLNSFATEACVFEIGQLRAIYWDGVGEERLERFGFPQADYHVEFEVKHAGTNESYRIDFGARSPTHYHPYASVVRDGQRLIFEFPAGLYDNLVWPNLTLYTARIHPQ